MRTLNFFLAASLATLATLATLAAACSAPPPEPAAGCNPLIGDDCLTPFPSSFHMGSDGKVNLPANALPTQNNGIVIHPDRLNTRDGFSPATPFLVYFKDAVDDSTLPTVDAPEASLQPTATAQVMDLDGKRIPCMAELDVNVGMGDRVALIIRPMVRLDAGTRYVIALVGLKDKTGKPIVAKGFAALRDKTPLNHALSALSSTYETDIFPALAKAGVDRKSVTLAWDVKTASEASSRLISMRDTSFSMSDSLTYAITSSTDMPNDAHLLREVLATVQTPNFLVDDSGKTPLKYGSDGQPVVRAVTDTPFVIHIPQCATTATAPLPIVVFGHGIFGNALDTLRNGTLEALADQYCAVFIATDWIGLADSDKTTIANILGADLNGLFIVTDRLQQAHVNAQTMTHIFLSKMLGDASMQVNGKPVSDGSQVYYIGVSLGGIQGGTFMGVSPDVTRGVLNVPGCEWSLLIFRSYVFDVLKPLLQSALPDPLDEQVAIAATQGEWDYTDPVTFAPHLLGTRGEPLAAPGGARLPAKQVLVQESEGDALVSNLSTRVLARTIGLTGFDLTTPVYGIAVGNAPMSSAYTQWNSHPSPLPPPGDTALDEDNGAHEAVAGNPLAQQQMQSFLRTGMAQSVCNGACNISN
jgi:hypothetical protein